MCAESLGTSAALFDVPVTVKAPAAVSGSPMVKASGPIVAPDTTAWLSSAEIVGGSLTLVTPMTNTFSTKRPP